MRNEYEAHRGLMATRNHPCRGSRPKARCKPAPAGGLGNWAWALGSVVACIGFMYCLVNGWPH